MKKSIIAMAVAGALAVPAIASADATLYGHVMMAVDSVKDQKLEIGSQANSESRIGLRGTAATGIDGVSGVYQFEFGVNTNQTSYDPVARDADGVARTDATTGAIGNPNTLRTRLANAGLTGGFGTVLLGSQWTPHYSWATSRTDIMMSSAANVLNPTQGGIFRVSDSLAYVSPSFGGFQVAAAIVANGVDGSKTTDVHHVAARYEANGFGAALSWVDFTNTEARAIAASAGYDFGAGMVALGYAENRNADGTDTVKPWDLAVSYKVADATTLKYVYADHRGGAKGHGLELQHDLSNMVNTFVGYGYANSNLRDPGTTTNDTFSAGMRVRF